MDEFESDSLLSFDKSECLRELRRLQQKLVSKMVHVSHEHVDFSKSCVEVRPFV